MIPSIPKRSIKPGYRPQSDDKTPEADAIDFYLLRQLTNSQRSQMAAKLNRWAKTVSLRGMKKACPSTYKERFARSMIPLSLKIWRRKRKSMQKSESPNTGWLTSKEDTS